MIKKCPFFKKPCLEHGCVMYGHVLGKNPQTHADMDYHDCSFNLLPVLQIENAKEARVTAKAVYDLRNKVDKKLTEFVDVVRRATGERQPVSHDSGDVPVLTDSVGGNGKHPPGSPDRLSDDAVRS